MVPTSTKMALLHVIARGLKFLGKLQIICLWWPSLFLLFFLILTEVCLCLAVFLCATGCFLAAFSGNRMVSFLVLLPFEIAPENTFVPN